MLIIVTSDNILLFFLSWEGVGVCSYLLINFWYTRVQANKAAIKALLINRVGDIFLLIGINLVFLTFSTFDFTLLNSLITYNLYITNITFYQIPLITNLTLIGLCFIIGAVGKSAQLGLHSWIPDAMEGPTPVSALLHAATMVTAGVFLLLKCYFVLEYNTLIQNSIIIWGIITAFFAASIACTQTDLKKIIAYSTCSQLGYMIFTIGLSQYQLSLFHLFTHAFFKALLFISAGIAIHSFYDEQDTRKMGNIRILLPSVYVINIIATLTITGFLFTSGFYSKDIIIETAYNTIIITNSAVYWLAVFTAALTSFYSFKSLFIVFYGVPNVNKYKIEQFHLVSNLMLIPIVLLSFFSCFVGYVVKELFVGLGTNNFLFINIPESSGILTENEFIGFEIKLIPLVFSFCGACVAIYSNIITQRVFSYYKLQLSTLTTIKSTVSFFTNKYYIDNVINKLGYKIFRTSYTVPYKLIDKNLIEYCLVWLSSQMVIKCGIFFSYFNSGVLTHHISSICITIVFFLSIFIVL
jgi:proton-translocating NADH-quinone oxidoreductase chain L